MCRSLFDCNGRQTTEWIRPHGCSGGLVCDWRKRVCAHGLIFHNGVAAGLAPWFRFPLDGGVPASLCSARIKLPGGGEGDFLHAYDEHVAPNTCDAVRLDAIVCNTTSVIMNALDVNSSPSAASPSSKITLFYCVRHYQIRCTQCIFTLK